MKFFVVFVSALIPTIVWSQKNSCVCDCDAVGAVISTAKPTVQPVVKPTKPLEDSNFGQICACKFQYQAPHLFCGARKEELSGNCDPNILYNCGTSAKGGAIPHMKCRQGGCVPVYSEVYHGKDRCN